VLIFHWSIREIHLLYTLNACSGEISSQPYIFCPYSNRVCIVSNLPSSLWLTFRHVDSMVVAMD
jgi:hypothetical protein